MKRTNILLLFAAMLIGFGAWLIPTAPLDGLETRSTHSALLSVSLDTSVAVTTVASTWYAPDARDDLLLTDTSVGDKGPVTDLGGSITAGAPVAIMSDDNTALLDSLESARYVDYDKIQSKLRALTCKPAVTDLVTLYGPTAA